MYCRFVQTNAPIFGLIKERCAVPFDPKLIWRRRNNRRVVNIGKTPQPARDQIVLPCDSGQRLRKGAEGTALPKKRAVPAGMDKCANWLPQETDSRKRGRRQYKPHNSRWDRPKNSSPKNHPFQSRRCPPEGQTASSGAASPSKLVNETVPLKSPINKLPATELRVTVTATPGPPGDRVPPVWDTLSHCEVLARLQSNTAFPVFVSQ